jgi:hypothetical protein
MHTLLHTNDCGQLEEVVNPGEENSSVFTRIPRVGVTLHDSNGHVIFMTDELLTELARFVVRAQNQESQS